MNARAIALLAAFGAAVSASGAKLRPWTAKQYVARALAVLEYEATPFNPYGWNMVETEAEARKCNQQLLKSAPRIQLGEFNEPASAATPYKVLPPGFYSKLDELTKGFQSDEIEIAPDNRLTAHGGIAEVVNHLGVAYESYAPSHQSGLGRSWAAWVVGEAGAQEAVPALIHKWQGEDPSGLAQAMYIIALARLKGSLLTKQLLFLARDGNSKSLYKWSERAMPFWLPNSTYTFTFPLSERAAAVLGMAYLPRIPADAQSDAIDAFLLETLDGLLAAPVKNPALGRGGKMRLYGFGSEPDSEVLLQAVLFAIARREIPDAFTNLSLYLNSLGHYSTGWNIQVGAKGPQGALHSVQLLPLLAAMHRIDPKATLKAAAKKIKELNGYYSTLTPREEAYWLRVYADRNLLGAMDTVFTSEEMEKFVRAHPIVPHSTHGDFLGGGARPSPREE